MARKNGSDPMSTGNNISAKEIDQAGVEEAVSSKQHLQFRSSPETEGSAFNVNRKWMVDYYIKFPLLGFEQCNFVCNCVSVAILRGLLSLAFLLLSLKPEDGSSRNGNALICTALLIKCSGGTSSSNTAPLTVFIAYSIANAYIILEYRIWQRISRLSRQIFGTVGALAFIMEGTKEIYLSTLYSSINELDGKSFTAQTAEFQQERLTSVAALSLFEAGLYFVEVLNLIF